MQRTGPGYALAGALAVSSVLALVACDQLNRPMPVTNFGTSASSTGGPPTMTTDDGGASDAGLPMLPREGDAPRESPRFTPAPGDVHL